MTGKYSLDLFRLDGRVAIVTGGASGMGKRCAYTLADAGAHVVAVDLNAAGLEETKAEMAAEGYEISTVVADISDESAVADMVKAAAKVTGRIDILLNAAGIGARSPATDYTLELWNKVLRINARGSFLCARAVAPYMIRQQKGAIVNFASCGAVVGWAGSVGYQCSKAGVAQMSRSLAVEWGEHNIRVNAIAPGYVDTPQTQAEAALEPEFFAERIRRVPMGRGAKPEEIPGTVLFLVSDAASMVTGNLVATDGGFLVA